MSSANITIRLALPADDHAIGELLIDAFVRGYAEKMPEVVVHDQRKSDLRDVATKRLHAAVLAAESGGKIVGSVTLYPPKAPTTEAWLPNAANLRYLGIDLEQRGAGISSLLLEATEKLAREWGCEAICLHTRRGAYGVARTYLKRGYVRDESGDQEKPGIYLEGHRLALA